MNQEISFVLIALCLMALRFLALKLRDISEFEKILKGRKDGKG